MKKLLVATILILSLTSIPIYAQDSDTPVDIQIEEVEEEEQETTTLSEELQVSQESNIGFLTILFAVLTPALLIVVAYLLIKMSNK